MKKLLWIVPLLLVIAAVVSLLIFGVPVPGQKGYVLIAFESFRYESTLWSFLLLVLALCLLVYGVRLCLRILVTSGGLVNPWSRLHNNRRARIAARRGYVELVEGHYPSALRHLKRAADTGDEPLAYFLGAARAAHNLGRYEESDELLEAALNQQPQAELAIALQHAEMQQERGEMDSALETLHAMRTRFPHHQQVLRQLKQVYLQREDWSGLVGLLPELSKASVLGNAELGVLEQSAWRGRLLQTVAHSAGDNESIRKALQEVWSAMPSPLHKNAEIVAVYVDQLRLAGADAQAEELLRSAIKQRYDTTLARLYGLLQGADAARQLKTAEGWLKEHPDDAGLLLTLGRLCLRTQLWGKARDYLESSLRFQQHPETCAELAHLLAQQGELARSNELYQEGLRLLDSRLSLPLIAKVG
ncbi:heme biosynthesis HemY N-terminal domain-containing protein [Ectopseudomonas mendocina]|uniref:Heme biosynthesis HemY N-terminal domain-containing protein n=1 Tax=Ectopseudomonas mendocina TaxID=300 RepID=A0ABZ2RHP5_ECTME